MKSAIRRTKRLICRHCQTLCGGNCPGSREAREQVVQRLRAEQSARQAGPSDNLKAALAKMPAAGTPEFDAFMLRMYGVEKRG